MRRDFMWAISELALGNAVRRTWWPRIKFLARDEQGTTVLMVGPLHTSFTASRGDINATDWVQA